MNLSTSLIPLFTILHWNVQRFVNCALDLSLLLADNNSLFSIIYETWLRPKKNISLPQYHILCSDTWDVNGGVPYCFLSISSDETYLIKRSPKTILL